MNIRILVPIVAVCVLAGVTSTRVFATQNGDQAPRSGGCAYSGTTPIENNLAIDEDGPIVPDLKTLEGIARVSGLDNRLYPAQPREILADWDSAAGFVKAGTDVCNLDPGMFSPTRGRFVAIVYVGPVPTVPPNKNVRYKHWMWVDRNGKTSSGQPGEWRAVLIDMDDYTKRKIVQLTTIADLKEWPAAPLYETVAGAWRYHQMTTTHFDRVQVMLGKNSFLATTAMLPAPY